MKFTLKAKVVLALILFSSCATYGIHLLWEMVGNSMVSEEIPGGNPKGTYQGTLVQNSV